MQNRTTRRPAGNFKAHYLGRGNEPGSLILPDGTACSRDSRETGLNNNVLIVGQAGTGKSSTVGIPNLLEANASFVVSDPKGGLFRSANDLLTRMGYRVLRLDLTHPERSAKYNPLLYVNTSQEIRKLAHTIVMEGYPGHRDSRDPYWENSADSLLCALIAFLKERRQYPNFDYDRYRMHLENVEVEKKEPYPEPTLTEVSDLLSSMEVGEDPDDRKNTPVFRDFIQLDRAAKRQGKKSWAVKMFAQFRALSEKTLSCVVSTLASLLTPVEGDELTELFSGNDFDFRRIGQEKTALFVIVSDTDRSNDLLANMFYTQVMNELCDFADNDCPEGRLPVPVVFMLDDFATNAHIQGFENMISNIRARNISAMLMIQSLHQLRSGYGEDAETIMNNCDTTVFMGANSLGDAEHFCKRANKPVHTMLDMPRYSSWVFRHGTPAQFMKNRDPEEYLRKVAGCLKIEQMWLRYNEIRRKGA